jgi:hypothetical protein
MLNLAALGIITTTFTGPATRARAIGVIGDGLEAELYALRDELSREHETA